MSEISYAGGFSAGLPLRRSRPGAPVSRPAVIGIGVLALLCSAGAVAMHRPLSPLPLPAFDFPSPNSATPEATARMARPNAAAATLPGPAVASQAPIPSEAPRTDRLPDARAAWWLPAGMTRSQPERTARFTPAALRPPTASRARKLVLTARLLESAEDVSALASGLAQQAAELADADKATSLAEEVPANVPLPVTRPHKLAEAVPVPAETPSQSPFGEVLADTSKPAADAVPDNVPLPAARPRGPIRTLLAYLRPDDSAESTRASVGRVALPGPGSGVAVYDIKAATVYLPNGQRLEAHSGLGRMHDKPKYADEKNRGPTPPNVYNLVMRERPFHGVEAIRLLPADGVNKYNRVGLLAHTYMLHGTNQSNGCVVFKNYSRFLKAFKKGKIDRMVVVPEISALPRLMASL